MFEDKERLAYLEKSNTTLCRTVTSKSHEIYILKQKIEELKDRLSAAESALTPTREALNRMTAENGKYKIKLKRLGA